MVGKAEKRREQERTSRVGVALALLEVQRTHDEGMDLVHRAGIALPETVSVDVLGIALDLLGVPADNTLEMIDKHGELWHEAEGLYCRDFIGDIWDATISKRGSLESFLAALQGELSPPAGKPWRRFH